MFVTPGKNAVGLKVSAARLGELLNIFAAHHFVEHHGEFSLVYLPHTLETNRILRNMGVDTTGCEVFKFKYTLPNFVTPWWFQIETAAFLSENLRAYCTSTPRTGKTLSTAMATDFLQRTGKAKGVLIIAPLATLDNVWEDTYAQFGKTIFVAHGTKDERREMLASAADVYIINPDGVKLMQEELEEMVDMGRIEIVVVDELTNYANARTARWKALNHVILPVKYAWGLTGTPGDPTHVYGQVKLITPTNMRMPFNVWQARTMYKQGPFKWVPSYGHEEKIKAAMSPCIRFDKTKVMTVPIPEVKEVKAPLSSDQIKAYEDMRKQLLTTVGKTQVTAATAAVMASKLLQISAGCVIGDTGVEQLPMPARLTVLKGLIDSTQYKTVIFAAFTAVIDRLVEDIAKMGFTCAKIDGSTSRKKRSNLFDDFMKERDPHVLICHPGTTAFGVELAAADKLIFFGPPMSGNFTYQQACERLSSAEQRSATTYVYHLSSSPAEHELFGNVLHGVEINNNIVNTLNTVLQTSLYT